MRLSVSVVVAVRNGVRYLSEALASLRAQTVPAAEILVVDGGSTDGTIELARGERGVTVLAQVGETLADAYNTGVSAARGDLVAFLSHDDLAMPRKLELQCARLEAEPALEMCTHWVEYFLEPGSKTPPGFRSELLDGPRPARVMETLAARRELFRRIGGLDPRVSPCDDVEWFARAQDLGVSAAVLPEVLVRKRIHGGNTSLAPAATGSRLIRSLKLSIDRKRGRGTGA